MSALFLQDSAEYFQQQTSFELSPVEHATDVILQALAMAERPVLTTNFRPGAVVLLHLLREHAADIPVVWVDTGYNTPATYRYVDRLVEDLGLDLHVYTPRITEAHRAARGLTVPTPKDDGFDAFVEEVKLEPFRRAFAELKPDVWFTGIRREQTATRAATGIYSRGAAGSLKVAPLLDWTQADIDLYVSEHNLPNSSDYVDPTKPGEKLECGIQLLR